MGNGESITIGKSYWHACWKVDLSAATVRASKKDPAQSVMAIDGMFNNLGKDDATPNSALTLEAGDESLPLDDEETELPQVPGGGKQHGTIVFDLKDTSQIPSIAEPWFLAFNARLTITPTMNPQDLANAQSGIEQAVKTYGKTSNL